VKESFLKKWKATLTAGRPGENKDYNGKKKKNQKETKKGIWPLQENGLEAQTMKLIRKKTKGKNL